MTVKPILRVLGGEPVWPPPVWLMRQAGRYLPEFRAIRSQADFMTRCLTPDLATEITLQPIRRYGMDAAILFSDILILPWALGQDVRFIDGTGPVLAPIRTEAELAMLDVDSVVERVGPVLETLRRLRADLGRDHPDCTLLGFAGSPFTVACYMVDGGGGRDFPITRRLAYADAPFFRRLLEILTDTTASYLAAQAEAGAEALVLFDSWSGLLPPPLFEAAVIAPTARITRSLKSRFPDIPIIGFPRLAGVSVGSYAARAGVDAVALDTGADPAAAQALIGGRVALQGNLDPLCLVAGGEILEREATRIADAFRGRPHIFNLGHGVLPETPPAHVGALVEAVRRG